MKVVLGQSWLVGNNQFQGFLDRKQDSHTEIVRNILEPKSTALVCYCPERYREYPICKCSLLICCTLVPFISPLILILRLAFRSLCAVASQLLPVSSHRGGAYQYWPQSLKLPFLRPLCSLFPLKDFKIGRPDIGDFQLWIFVVLCKERNLLAKLEVTHLAIWILPTTKSVFRDEQIAVIYF